ncbi:MAG: hypothetical protein DMF65_06785 [Acidobacteria bacterium]|nr:MAG: hypothetical protein DMF65_06785 [Acidobacteriota bacterium]
MLDLKKLESEVQYVTNQSGEKTAVIVPIEEFEELLEDVEDLAAVGDEVLGFVKQKTGPKPGSKRKTAVSSKRKKAVGSKRKKAVGPKGKKKARGART